MYISQSCEEVSIWDAGIQAGGVTSWGRNSGNTVLRIYDRVLVIRTRLGGDSMVVIIADSKGVESGQRAGLVSEWRGDQME